MQKFTHRIITRRKAVIALFAALTVICGIMCFFVDVNFTLADYLPNDAPSTTALNVMDDQFDGATPNLRVYVPDVTVSQALEMKRTLLETYGVSSVMWLDDSVDVRQPLEMADSATVEAFYKDGGALFQVTSDPDCNDVDVLNAVRAAAGETAAICGDLADSAASQLAVVREVGKSIIILAPLIILILILTTGSWLEPLLFIIIIVVSIVINYGSNALLGRISFLTQSIAPVLQLAVSMDYVIFLLSAFNRFRSEGQEPEKAMESAVAKMASTVIASGATTFAGFIVLVLMDFKIGPDLGIVLAKGIIISMASAMILLPAITLAMLKAIDKTAHRSFMPSFKKFGKFTSKLKIPALILVIVLIVPCYLGQQNVDFSYGSAGISEGSQIGDDTDLINSVFGRSAYMVLIVPRGDNQSEAALCGRLKQMNKVTSVISYTQSVGRAIPPDFLDESQSSQLISEDFSRIIVTADMADEGDEAFAAVENVRALAAEYYGDGYYLCGTNVNNYDMRSTVIDDNRLVSIVALIAVGLIILLTFKSISLPIILLLTIQSAIWINLSIPYFTDTKMPYLAYLVVNTVQLGATIDYAILFTEHYLDFRKTLPKGKAMMKTSELSAPSILAPACILAGAGLALGLVSTNGIVRSFGSILCRGTILSAVLVLVFLPGILYLLDGLVENTTLKLSFLKERTVIGNETKK